jgi:hypothetical protein
VPAAFGGTGIQPVAPRTFQREKYLVTSEPLAKLFLCHPERSEGSQPPENTRFFVPLRMTMVVNKQFCQSLQ